MKNLILTTLMGGSLGFATLSATAGDFKRDGGNQNYRLGMTWPWSHGLQEAINHLNRMRGHVRWQLRNYRGNREVRRDFVRVSRDIDQINARFRSGTFNRNRLRSEVERAHHELHRIEIALHVKQRDFYPWR